MSVNDIEYRMKEYSQAENRTVLSGVCPRLVIIFSCTRSAIGSLTEFLRRARLLNGIHALSIARIQLLSCISSVQIQSCKALGRLSFRCWANWTEPEANVFATISLSLMYKPAPSSPSAPLKCELCYGGKWRWEVGVKEWTYGALSPLFLVVWLKYSAALAPFVPW